MTHLLFVFLSKSTFTSNRTSGRIVVDSFVANCPEFHLFMDDFIPGLDMLGLSVSVRRPPTLLLTYITGFQVSLFLIQRKRAVYFWSNPNPDFTPQATVKVSHFLKLHFPKSNRLYSQITSETLASNYSLPFYLSVKISAFSFLQFLNCFLIVVHFSCAKWKQSVIYYRYQRKGP